MSSLNDITNGLENRSPMMRAAAGPTNQPDPHAAITQELLDLRTSIEAILIWLKITNRLSEAQYSFVFGHVADCKPVLDEPLEEFLTRSAIELDKKLKNAGLI